MLSNTTTVDMIHSQFHVGDSLPGFINHRPGHPVFLAEEGRSVDHGCSLSTIGNVKSYCFHLF